MPNTINFIRERRTLLTKDRAKDKQLFKVSLLSFIITLLIAIGLVTFNIITSGKIASSVRSQAQLKDMIQQSQVVELKYTVLLDKMKLVSNLFGARKDKQEALAYFSSLFDDSVKVSGIQYTEEDKSLAFSLDVPSLFKLEKVLQTLDSDNLKSQFGEIQKHGLSRNNDGHYTVQIGVLLIDAK